MEKTGPKVSYSIEVKQTVLQAGLSARYFSVPKVPHRNPGREVGYPTESRGHTTAGVLSNLGVPCAWVRGSGARGTFAVYALGKTMTLSIFFRFSLIFEFCLYR